MKKTIALVRVSTNVQDTLSQRASIENYCKENRIFIDEWLDDTGISGSRVALEDRESLSYIKELAQRDKLEMLIVFNSDRIIRDTSGTMYLKMLRSCGVKILSVTEGELFKNDDVDELMSFIRFWNSSVEVKKLSNRIIAGKKASVEENGHFGGSIAPFGYILKDAKLSVDKEKTAIIKKMFELYLETNTSTVLAYLDSLGFHFTRSRLLRMFRNTVYIGQTKSKFNAKYNEDLRIISDELFYKVEQAIKSRTLQKGNVTKRANRSNLLLEGLVYHKCKDGKLTKLSINWTYTKAKKKFPTYRCEYCREHRVDTKKTYGADKLLRIVEKEIKEQLKFLSVERLENEYNARKATELAEIQSEIDILTNTLNTKNKALTGANNTLESILSGELNIDINIIANKIKDIQNDIIELETKLSELDTEFHKKELESMNRARLKEVYKDFKYIYNVADMNGKKLILNELIDKVLVYENDIELILNL